MITDETLKTYYDIRSQADRREAAARPGRPPRDSPLLQRIKTANRELYRSRLGSLAGLVVGEVGVGAGDFARYALAQRPKTLVLIDLSQDRLHSLGLEGAATRLVAAPAERMEGVADGELDLLVAEELIEHLRDYRTFLKEAARVVRPGGRLYLTTPNRACIDLWPRLLFARFARKRKADGEALVREVFDGIYEFLTPDEVRTLAEILPPGFREHIHEFAPLELLRALREHGFEPRCGWGTPPKMLYNEFRALASFLLPAWNRLSLFSYLLGDDLRLIAARR